MDDATLEHWIITLNKSLGDLHIAIGMASDRNAAELRLQTRAIVRAVLMTTLKPCITKTGDQCWVWEKEIIQSVYCPPPMDDTKKEPNIHPVGYGPAPEDEK